MPKYAAECQGCKDSLTIIYTVHDDDPNHQVPFMEHLAGLLAHHLKDMPADDDHAHTPIDLSNIPPTDVKKQLKKEDLEKLEKHWMKQIKPAAPW